MQRSKMQASPARRGHRKKKKAYLQWRGTVAVGVKHCRKGDDPSLFWHLRATREAMLFLQYDGGVVGKAELGHAPYQRRWLCGLRWVAI